METHVDICEHDSGEILSFRPDSMGLQKTEVSASSSRNSRLSHRSLGLRDDNSCLESNMFYDLFQLVTHMGQIEQPWVRTYIIMSPLKFTNYL